MRREYLASLIFVLCLALLDFALLALAVLHSERFFCSLILIVISGIIAFLIKHIFVPIVLLFKQRSK